MAWAMFGVTPMSRSRSGVDVGVSWSAGDRLAEPGALVLEVDGKVTPIEVLAAAQDPLELEILRDESRSMDYGDRVTESSQVLNCVLGQLQRRDVVRLAGFAEAGAEERVATSNDRELVGRALRAWPTQGVTSLLDALSWLGRDARPSAGALRKISVVVTDGGDNSSRLTLRKTRELLGNIEHAVVILDAAGHERPYGGAGRDRASLLLQELAHATGGLWLSTAAPEAACRSLAQLARSHLLVGFPVDASTPSGRHRLRLRVAPEVGDHTLSRRKIVLRHRREYTGHAPARRAP